MPYFTSDKEPIAETDIHRNQLIDALIYPLKEYFRNEPDVYVSGNLSLCYDEYNPHLCVTPDVFIAMGVANRKRQIYKVWEEGKAPDVVIELTSARTRQKDLVEKRLLYEQLNVRDYFIFDPLHEYLLPPLRGFRLQDGDYVSLNAVALPNGDWELASKVLGLTLRTSGDRIRLYDPQREHYLLTHAEEAEARRQAEARLAEVEAELARLRALPGCGP